MNNKKQHAQTTANESHARLRSAVAMRLTLQHPVPERTTAPAYEALLVSGAISREVDAVVDAFVEQSGTTSATRSIRRRYLRRYLIWRAAQHLSCAIGADQQADIDAYLAEVPAREQARKTRMVLREWRGYLTARGQAPMSSLVIPGGGWAGYRQRLAGVDPQLDHEINALEQWLIDTRGHGGIDDERTIRYVAASTARAALALRDDGQVVAALGGRTARTLVEIFGCTRAVAEYLRGLTIEVDGPRQGEALTAASRRREFENLVWTYRYLESEDETTEAIAGARQCLRDALQAKTGSKLAVGGRRSSGDSSAPATADIARLRETMELATLEERDRCGYNPDDPTTEASTTLIGLLLDRALIEVSISSMTRAESLATMDESRITAEHGGDYYLAREVRYKRTRGRDGLWADWVLFPATLESHVEPYLHATGRCLAIGLPGCAPRTRLGPPVHLGVGAIWGDTTLQEPRIVYPLWRAPNDMSRPLLYDTMGVRLRHWLHQYHYPDGTPYHLHHLRRFGASIALNDLRLPLAWVQTIGHWERPDTLLRLYARAQEDEALRAVGQQVYPARAGQSQDPRRRASAALAVLGRCEADLRALVGTEGPDATDAALARIATRIQPALEVLRPATVGEDTVTIPRRHLALIVSMARTCQPDLADAPVHDVLQSVFPGTHLSSSEPPAPSPRRERTVRTPVGRGLGLLS